jgi:hypothetical protein
MTGPDELRTAAGRTCERLAASTGAAVGVVRRFDRSWVPLAGEVVRAPLPPTGVAAAAPVRLGPDWALAPLADRDGALFGAVVVRGAALEGVAGLLVGELEGLEELLFRVRAAEHDQRVADREPRDAELDLRSGTGTPGYWRRCLAAEERRALLLEHPATVLLTAPVARTGERWLAPSVTALRQVCRSVDVLARPETDLLAVLAVECPGSAADALAARLRASLLEAGVAVGCGTASRRPGAGLTDLVGLARDRLRRDLTGREVLRL